MLVALASLLPWVLGELVVTEEELAALPVDSFTSLAELVEEEVVAGECSRRTFHYWVEGPAGRAAHNGSVVTALAPHSRVTFGEDSLVLRPELNCMEHDSEELIDALNRFYIYPPSEASKEAGIAQLNYETRNRGVGEDDISQDLFLDKFVFKGKVKGGFFVEAGADDFIRESNTLWFEARHQWTGLLAEPVIGQFVSGWVSLYFL